jgi:hypothetical protein
VWPNCVQNRQYATDKNRKEPEGTEIVRKFLVAATIEKARTYVFAEMVIHNPKVGSSILPPATIESTTYSGQQWPLFVIVGKIAGTVDFLSVYKRFDRSPQPVISRVCVTR